MCNPAILTADSFNVAFTNRLPTGTPKRGRPPTAGSDCTSFVRASFSEASKTGTSITFRAAGNAFNSIAKRMELWIDATKVGQDLEDQLKITAALAVVVEKFRQHSLEIRHFHRPLVSS
jgi:hypothetical protein